MCGARARADPRYVTLLDIEFGKARRAGVLRTHEDTYATALMFVAERFQILLETATTIGIIVVDSRFREQDARLRRFFADLTKTGRPYFELHRIVEGLFLGPSDHSIGLQCADLVCEHRRRRARGRPGAWRPRAPPPRFATTRRPASSTVWA